MEYHTGQRFIWNIIYNFHGYETIEKSYLIMFEDIE